MEDILLFCNSFFHLLILHLLTFHYLLLWQGFHMILKMWILLSNTNEDLWQNWNFRLSEILICLDMFNQASRIFTQELDQTMENCKYDVNKRDCVKSLAIIKKSGEDCFEKEERFTNSNCQWFEYCRYCFPLFTVFCHFSCQFYFGKFYGLPKTWNYDLYKGHGPLSGKIWL